MQNQNQYAALVRYASVCGNVGHQPITDDRTLLSQSQRSAERQDRDAAAERRGCLEQCTRSNATDATSHLLSPYITSPHRDILQHLLSFAFNQHPCDSSGLPSSALSTAFETLLFLVCQRRTSIIIIWRSILSTFSRRSVSHKQSDSNPTVKYCTTGIKK